MLLFIHFCGKQNIKKRTHFDLTRTPTQKQPDAKKIVDIIKNRVGRGISPADR